MNDLLTRLKNILDLTKIVNITLPGLIAAVGLAVILWPPLPSDIIHRIRNFDAVITKGVSCELVPVQLPVVSGVGFKASEYMKVRRDRAQEAQTLLESAQRELDYCITQEASLQGSEEDQIAKLKYKITVLEKEREPLQQQYLSYQKAGSRFAVEAEDAYRRVDSSIASLWDQIAKLDRGIKERQFQRSS